ncbi:MAG TPA: hypothetical protein VGM17_01290 [Rhizomicrobium sp.]|jgi:hypothetical protein
MSLTNPSPIPHPTDLIEEDLAQSRKLLADCMEGALDHKGAYVNVRLQYMAAATRLLRHNAHAAGLLLREAHTCIRDMERRPKPPPSMRRQKRPADGDREWFIDDDAELRAEAEKISKTTSAAGADEKISKTTSDPAIRVA